MTKNQTLIRLTNEVAALNNQFTTLKNEIAANTQAKGKNTEAVEASTEGLGRWEKKDEEYHKEHHNIISEISKDQKEILKLLEKK